MIKFRKVTESDEQLNSQIEALNRKVFPSTETTANLHFTLMSSTSSKALSSIIWPLNPSIRVRVTAQHY